MKVLNIFLALLISLSTIFTPKTEAKENTDINKFTNSINWQAQADEKIKVGDVVRVFGDALGEGQRQQVADIFNKNIMSDVKLEDKDITTTQMSSSELEHYLGYEEGTSAGYNMISCVQIEKLELGSGTYVEIATPKNITQITHHEYTNASITAGLDDVYIQVAALTPATGEAALAGIYKAAETLGFDLNEEQLAVGNEEMEVVNEISQENKDNPDFNIENFNAAVNNIKQEITIKVEDNSVQNVSRDEINVIVNNNLEQYNINLTDEQIAKLSEYMQKFKDSLANIDEADLEKLKQQLSQFGSWLSSNADNVKEYLNSDEFKQGLNQFKEEAGNIYENAKESGLFDKIADFFSRLWDALVRAFSK